MRQELMDEPLNRILIVDKNCQLSVPDYKTYELWMCMNLILLIDYKNNTFKVEKNRWGKQDVTLPVSLLPTFLFHPELTDEESLNVEKLALSV